MDELHNRKMGLTAQQVLERQEAGLSNQDGTVQTKTVKQIIKENTMTLFNLVNLLLALCILLVGSYRNMLFMGVVISNLLIGVLQEVRAKRTIDRLSIVSAAKAEVLRDGQELMVQKEEIVLDDILILKAGMQICADASIIEGKCEVNESLLTGESDSLSKEPSDLLLSGSYMVSGQVYARVVKVGLDSYANKIMAGAKYIKKVNSEIKKSIMWIVRAVTLLIFPISVFLFLNQLEVEGQSFQRSVVTTVAALIGMIPEGLVLLISVVMAISVIRLGRKKILVQEPYCVETLARVDVFCMDKTGTITEGNMELTGSEAVSEEKYTMPLQEMMSALSEDNPTFLAVKRAFEKESEWNCIKSIPFSSERKWSLAAFEGKGIYVLGAPEFVCRNMEETLRAHIQSHLKKGERVLLFARAEEVPEGRTMTDRVRPLALLFLDDVIRENASETVGYLKEQAVELKVISGDNPQAVSGIAQKIGIPRGDKYIDCSSLDSEEDLKKAVEFFTVFGRVSPEQKLTIVRELQARQHVVAMTGDGVNDVLALKEADCGIAMQSGSEAARNVSEIVLMNSDFGAIPAIIAEGRRAINNLTRSSSLFLVKTTFSCLLALIFCFLNRAYPFQPIQMSLISTICIGIPSFVLALEKNQNRVKRGFLKSVLKIAVPGGILAVANILCCVIINEWIPMNVDQVGTLAMYSCALVFSVILYKICYPFNLMRKIMYGMLVTIFLGVILLFGEVFYVVRLSWQSLLLLVVIELINIGVYKAYHIIIKKTKEASIHVRRKTGSGRNL